jgi:hypothetical protein
MPTTSKSTGKGGNNTPQPAKDRPVKVIRIRNVRANIWANRLGNGTVVHNVTFDRLYKEEDVIDEQGEVLRQGEWKQSASYGKDDLLLLAKISDLAHTWIYRNLQDDRRDQSF